MANKMNNKNTGKAPKNKQQKCLSKQMAMKIPYVRTFEEEGMIESAPGVYSKTYYVESVESNNLIDYNNAILTTKYAELLNKLPSNMNLQFIIHNRLISQNEYLKRILIDPEGKEPQLVPWINVYNKSLTENSDIGHNNVRKNKYFTISVEADTPEDAIKEFKSSDSLIKQLFHNIYGIVVEPLTTIGRLKVMYSMLNPKKNDFGKKIGNTSGNFKLKDIRKKGLTTKDCVAPREWDTTNKSYMIINNNHYVRAFFVASMPVQLSNNLISDITNISSNMIFSAQYEPIDTVYGYNVADNNVAENTSVTHSAKRDTIKDRRNKAQVRNETMIVENEKAYFERCAVETLKNAVAYGHKAMMCSFIIVLYGDTLEELDRDTKLLQISTSKFACQVKPLDLLQLQGLQSALPLGVSRVDVKRLFPVQKLAAIPPLNIQEVLQKDGQFNGLNAINDNLIILNRKNNSTMSGIISGTEHSGKTFQMKREIFNAMISTNDKVVIVSDKNEYDNFVKALGGCIVESCALNPFSMINHYGLINTDKYSKSLMLEALYESISRGKNAGMSIDGAKHSIESYEKYDRITQEVTSLINEIEPLGINIADINAVYEYCRKNADRYNHILTQEVNVKNFLCKENIVEGRSRLQLMKVHSLPDKVVMLDYLWNKSIQDKSQNVTTWVFLDSVDDFMTSEQCSTFFIDYVTKMDTIKNVFTGVIQSSVKLFTDNAQKLRTQDLLNTVGYHKLLNQGAIERQKYSEILNIGNSLINYVTSAELGKGIILTPASNVAFDDSFYTRDEMMQTFYKLFLV